VAAVTLFVVSLTGQQLYEGLEARHVLLKDGAVVLDARNWAGGKGEGQVTTDVLDLGRDGLLGTPVAVVKALVKADVQAKSPAAVVISLRSGTTYFQAPGTWTDWADVGDQPMPVKGRYAQVRIRLTSTSAAALPAVRSLTLDAIPERKGTFAGTVQVTSSAVENIIRSTIDFGYERQDQPDLVWLRKTFKLDEVIAGRKTEFEKLRALNTWCTSRKNDRTEGWNKNRYYPWNVRETLSEKDGGTVYGHCASFCQVMIAAAGSFGWQGRHVALEGYRRKSHEVPEIWINELKKWVWFDPSLDSVYLDAKTGTPLNMLEMHEVFLKHLYPNGAMLGSLDEDQQKANNRAINWATFPMVCKTEGWSYGEKNQPPDYWQTGHGFLCCGWMQMTPRNNFHSQPKPVFTAFGNGPGSMRDYPYWVDAQTGFRGSGIRNWYTRPRDWYWTLNQASLRLVRAGDDQVAVELGASQPFFKRFVARVNGGKPETVTSPYTWRLAPGDNTLEVNCEDEFGNAGLPSKVTLNYVTS
jgi:hypothetical protein